MPSVKYIIGIDEVGRAARKQASLARQSYVIGIDEVGRGPLAGPIVVAALALPLKLKIKYKKSKVSQKRKELVLRDSKRLSEKQRGEWLEYIQNHQKIFYTVASVSPAVIDRINISRAANLAATRAVQKLITGYQLPIAGIKIFLDGGLYLNSKFYILNSRTIVRGDETIPAIMLASIVAKVHRDKYMIKLHKKYPHYGFDSHKGYGTKTHRRAIKHHGLSPVHRISFRT